MAIVFVAAVVCSMPALAVPKAGPPPTSERHASTTSAAAREKKGNNGDAGTIVVSVLPGSLSVSTAQTPLVLQRMPGAGHTTRYRGLLPSVRVVDMRGSLIGWSATVRFFAPSSVPGTGLRLRTRPGQPVVVSGLRTGIHSGTLEWTAFETPVALFEAESGSGAGTYDDDAVVELVLPFASDIASIPLEYEASVT
jgi:hypothetical protein